MPKTTVEVLIEGGKATAAPPLGPALGPLGVNMGQIVAEINKLTQEFKGMQVPVKVIVDTETKEFELKLGTPPASQLIIKEAGISKGSGNPKLDRVADLKIEQIIKIAKMKESSLLGSTLKDKVKEIIGTCNSIGVMVEGVPAAEAISLVDEGKFDAEIRAEKTELTAAELKELEEEKRRLAEEAAQRRAELEAKAKEIIAELKGKEKAELKAKLREAKIPDEIIEQLLPEEKAEIGKAAAAAGKASSEKK